MTLRRGALRVVMLTSLGKRRFARCRVVKAGTIGVVSTPHIGGRPPLGAGGAALRAGLDVRLALTCGGASQLRLRL